jgi:hypothetical protein
MIRHLLKKSHVKVQYHIKMTNAKEVMLLCRGEVALCNGEVLLCQEEVSFCRIEMSLFPGEVSLCQGKWLSAR